MTIGNIFFSMKSPDIPSNITHIVLWQERNNSKRLKLTSKKIESTKTEHFFPFIKNWTVIYHMLFACFKCLNGQWMNDLITLYVVFAIIDWEWLPLMVKALRIWDATSILVVFGKFTSGNYWILRIKMIQHMADNICTFYMHAFIFHL